MKILNLYAGIGGNRKLWGDSHKITAVEYKKEIADIYNDIFPKDNIIIADAHEYLINNYKNFDMVWASPPCQTHSVTNHFLNAQGCIRYPDMKLYQEIILLQYLYKGIFVVENVKSYYTPLITPQQSGRHYFWANFKIPYFKIDSTIGRMGETKTGRTEGRNHYKLGYDLSKYKIANKKQLLNNCVSPEIGAAIIKIVENLHNDNHPQQNELF